MTVFFRRQAYRTAAGGRATSRGRSALARMGKRAVLPVAAVGGVAALSLSAPAVTAAAPAVTAAAPAAHLTSARPVPATRVHAAYRRAA